MPVVILNGAVTGDVRSDERIELAANARVDGDVHYKLIEMAVGAAVNGSLVHREETEQKFNDAARMRSSTCPGDGFGRGRSAAMSCSSPNRSRISITFIPSPLHMALPNVTNEKPR